MRFTRAWEYMVRGFACKLGNAVYVANKKVDEVEYPLFECTKQASVAIDTTMLATEAWEPVGDHFTTMIDFAKAELRNCRSYAGTAKQEEIQDYSDDFVMSLIEATEFYSNRGLLGYALERFRTLAFFHNLRPLSGKEVEWGTEICSTGLRQNKRDAAVFMRADGSCYYLYDKTFEMDNGDGTASQITNNHSRKDIDFPFMPPELGPPIKVSMSCDDYDPDSKCDRDCEKCPNHIQAIPSVAG